MPIRQPHFFATERQNMIRKDSLLNDNNSQGTHRAVAVAARSTVVAAAAVSVAVAFAGQALADDVQPGLSTTTPQQPGLSTTSPAPAPAAEPEGGYVAGFTPRYDYGGQTRTVEDYNAGRQTPRTKANRSTTTPHPPRFKGPASTSSPRRPLLHQNQPPRRRLRDGDENEDRADRDTGEHGVGRG
ncbi:hypothetical protein BJF84_26630 [Rhodococcus sp. CUA-806]|nr:hypothetical protein BJF84_26630 [Rhodococcus sp. CUA-806]